MNWPTAPSIIIAQILCERSTLASICITFALLRLVCSISRGKSVSLASYTLHFNAKWTGMPFGWPFWCSCFFMTSTASNDLLNTYSESWDTWHWNTGGCVKSMPCAAENFYTRPGSSIKCLNSTSKRLGRITSPFTAQRDMLYNERRAFWTPCTMWAQWCMILPSRWKLDHRV